MLKKISISFSAVLLLSFTSCGGESSDEAKELLSKILQFIGIPHSIIVNVCQDSNRDGICGAKELFTKLTIQKGESVDNILHKISLTADGRYFLETIDPTLPLLVEIQDVAKVNQYEGKFTLNFDGFKVKKDDNETKEISVLESMVDADALSKNEADTFRTLQNQEAQNKYYTALFDVLETNINTLRANNLDSKKSVTSTIKEMGDETKTNQEIANRINGCGNDQACVDREIKNISDELIITEEELLKILGKEDSKTPPKVEKWITPSKSICESNGGTYYDYNYDIKFCSATWEISKNICSASNNELPTVEVLSKIITDCGGVIDDYENNMNNDSYSDCHKNKGFQSRPYWTSNSDGYDEYDNEEYMGNVNFYMGTVGGGAKSNDTAFVCI